MLPDALVALLSVVSNSKTQRVLTLSPFSLQNQHPARLALSDALAAVAGVTFDTKAKVMQKLWIYVKSHNLSNPEQPHLVRCNEALEKVRRARQRIVGQLLRMGAPSD